MIKTIASQLTAFGVSLAFALCTLVFAPALHAESAQTVTQQQLMADRFSATPMTLLDVRSKQEYQQGHIKGAVNIPHSEIVENGATLNKDTAIVVYCRSGRRAGIALEALKKQGFTQLYHLEGDFLKWQQAELPLINQQ
ncbi:rhodanese-like domain-containing protein [Pseudoalteromonas sp. Cnat2-41]|uniref:rhodanese-like domain-containing protein n=1 Tax=unclassified Pseudoalteromonas TaxID=194690 RepID=UPI001EF9B133|nr:MULTISPECIES: rhodanese-like domain-containing protein [unclassified Pseudoalteromonas]MCF2863351.1 rhodanese-like domain-containing protein [Pseudoalteromonas sp. CNAT2-18]MCG7558304.1 rhodanese-like domain-containing protein [Pseudoalteromonas sp. CNAT2-18.1]